MRLKLQTQVFTNSGLQSPVSSLLSLSRRGTWLVDGVILTSWLLVVGLVIVYERGGLVGTWLRASRTIPAPLEVREQWFGLYYQGTKVGFTHLMLVPDERDGMPGVTIADRGRLRFTLLGVPQFLEIRTRAFIDADRQLRQVSMSVEAEGYQLQIEGRRQGDEMVLTITGPTSQITQRLKDPAGKLWIGGLSSWTAFHELKVGQEGWLWVVNPLALKPEAAHFYVQGREQLDGTDTLVIVTEYQGLSATTWLTPSGVVMKETSPMGWELIQESQQEALASMAQTPSIDLLSTVAVDVDQTLEDPAALAQLTLLVDGVDAGVFRVDRRPWQEMLSDVRPEIVGAAPPSGKWCVVQLTRPTLSSGLSAPSEALSRYTSASPFVQSEDPNIQRQARAIVGTRTDPWSQAVAIHDWVYRTLTKRLTVGLPTATDVLSSRAGDCHEHTVLFTALARSLGIPTRMLAGLVYYQGRFYYHAWPEVWVASHEGAERSSAGVWVPLDPTLGQVPADVTHLGFVEAENEALLALAQVVGQVRLRVLEIVRQETGDTRPETQDARTTTAPSH